MRLSSLRPALVMALLPLLPLRALADPGYYVITPYDRAGLATVELRYWTVKRANRPEVIWPELAIGYGVNTRWSTTLLASWEGTSHEAVQISTLNWQNIVMLTQGELPVDLALYGGWISARQPGEDDAYEWGPLLQTDIGRTHLNLNLLLERGTGASAAVPAQLKYQWQVKHRLAPGWQAGLQGFGEVGDWDHFATASKQSHRVGVALFAQVPGDGKRLLEVQGAVLQGQTYTKSGRMVSLRAAYSF
jgi:hypothetical protein